MALRPGSIVNVTRALDDTGYSKSASMKDWFKEERWKRVYDWLSEIDKELAQKEENRYPKMQLNRIRDLLTSIQHRSELREASISDFYIEDLKRFNRVWDRNSIRPAAEKSLEDMERESEKLRQDLDRLDRIGYSLRM